MPKICPDPFDRLEPGELDAHLAQCPECCARWHQHRQMLELMGGAEPPRLSPGFNARLMSRLNQESSLAAVQTGPWIALRIYAVAAALLSLFILARLDWSWMSSLTPMGKVLCALALLATPMVALFDFSWLQKLAGARFSFSPPPSH